MNLVLLNNLSPSKSYLTFFFSCFFPFFLINSGLHVPHSPCLSLAGRVGALGG